MTSNELRIGNLVYVDWKDAGKRVQTNYGVFNLPKGGMSGWSDVDGWRMNTVSNGYAVHLEIVSGIPLTEEWLLSFGFVVVHKNNQHYCIQDPNGYKDIYKIHIFPTINESWHIGFSDNLSGKDTTYSPTTKIKYVHQLQNLFFALTQMELEIK